MQYYFSQCIFTVLGPHFENDLFYDFPMMSMARQADGQVD